MTNLLAMLMAAASAASRSRSVLSSRQSELAEMQALFGSKRGSFQNRVHRVLNQERRGECHEHLLETEVELEPEERIRMEPQEDGDLVGAGVARALHVL